jgi:hypothetical protein
MGNGDRRTSQATIKAGTYNVTAGEGSCGSEFRFGVRDLIFFLNNTSINTVYISQDKLLNHWYLETLMKPAIIL